MNMKHIFNAIKTLNSKIGDDIAAYDVKSRRVYFFHHGDSGFRLKSFRNKRTKPIHIRNTDIFIKIDKNGDLSTEKDSFLIT